VCTKSRCSISRKDSSHTLRYLRSSRPKCRWDSPTGRTWHVFAPSPRAHRDRLDRCVDPTIPVPDMRPHDESVAGLAASIPLVCCNGNHRSSIPSQHSSGIRRIDWRPIWPSEGCNGMEESPTLAETNPDIFDAVGLAGSKIRSNQACRQ
jgi:hypothetical protein